MDAGDGAQNGRDGLQQTAEAREGLAGEFDLAALAAGAKPDLVGRGNRKEVPAVPDAPAGGMEVGPNLAGRGGLEWAEARVRGQRVLNALVADTARASSAAGGGRSAG